MRKNFDFPDALSMFSVFPCLHMSSRGSKYTHRKTSTPIFLLTLNEGCHVNRDKQNTLLLLFYQSLIRWM